MKRWQGYAQAGPSSREIPSPGCRRCSRMRKATSLAALARAAGGPRAVREPGHVRNLRAREPGGPVAARPRGLRAGRLGNAKAVIPGCTARAVRSPRSTCLSCRTRARLRPWPAEAVEERRVSVRNTDSETRPGRGAGPGVSSGLDRVREVAVREKDARFTALLHHITLERLWKVFTELKRDAAPGADGLTWGGSTSRTCGLTWRICSGGCSRGSTGPSRCGGC